MKDVDKSQGVAAPSVSRDIDEVEHLRMKLLETRLELEETRNAYKQAKDETDKLKRLVEEKRRRGTRDERPAPANNGVGEKIIDTADSRGCVCRLLQEEVTSLHTILELRNAELRDWQRRCAAAEQDAKQLSIERKANSALKFQIECLKQQLEKKSSAEQALTQENKTLLSSMQNESEQNRRLSLCNEELLWKLRRNATSEYRISPLAKPLAQSSPMVQRDSNYQPSSLRFSEQRLTPSTKENSLPQSPQVYGIVEKEGSMSWTIDMNEKSKEASVRREPTLSRRESLKSAKSSPAQLKTPKTYLTRLQKKNLLR